MVDNTNPAKPVKKTIRINDDETVSWKIEGFDWSIGKGKWRFTGKEVKVEIDGKEITFNYGKGVFNPTGGKFKLSEHKPKHIIREPTFGKPEAKVIGTWTMDDTKVKDSPVKTKIAIMKDGTVKTKDITNKGKWVTDPKWKWKYDDLTKKIELIIKSITIKFTKNPFKPGFISVDKNIKIHGPKLTFDTPTKTDHIDPSTGKEWGIDPKTDKPFDVVKDVKWPKDPVTNKPIAIADLDDEDKEIIKDIVNPHTGKTFDKDPETGKEWPKKEDKIPKPVPLKPVKKPVIKVVVEVVVEPGVTKPVVKPVAPKPKPAPKPYRPPKRPTGIKPKPKPVRPVPRPKPIGKPSKPYKPVQDLYFGTPEAEFVGKWKFAANG